MAGRTRTQKKLAQRINLDYFKTLHGIPRWRRILSGVLVIVGLGWLAWHAVAKSPTPYNAGPLSPSHALFTQKCDACHVPQAGFQNSATDQACQGCHDGPIHQASQTFSPSCSSCHVEHKGELRLAATSDRACTQCHADLKTTHGATKLAANITGFNGSHPEFAALRAGAKDPGTIKFNHQVHLKPDLRGPTGTVQLKCAECHQLSADERSYMQPVNYEKHCASCHTLQFDRRFSESVPHKDPQVVYDFAHSKLAAYIAAHPAEIPLVDEPDKRLPTRPPQPPARNAAEWVEQRMTDARPLDLLQDVKAEIARSGAENVYQYTSGAWVQQFGQQLEAFEPFKTVAKSWMVCGMGGGRTGMGVSGRWAWHFLLPCWWLRS